MLLTLKVHLIIVIDRSRPFDKYFKRQENLIYTQSYGTVKGETCHLKLKTNRREKRKRYDEKIVKQKSC